MSLTAFSTTILLLHYSTTPTPIVSQASPKRPSSATQVGAARSVCLPVGIACTASHTSRAAQYPTSCAGAKFGAPPARAIQRTSLPSDGPSVVRAGSTEKAAGGGGGGVINRDPTRQPSYAVHQTCPEAIYAFRWLTGPVPNGRGSRNRPRPAEAEIRFPLHATVLLTSNCKQISRPSSNYTSSDFTSLRPASFYPSPIKPRLARSPPAPLNAPRPWGRKGL